jgi:CBS domain containing-hemolysin-like protein
MNDGVLAFLALVAAAGLLFFALVEMAFTLLMRLPQRLEAEREGDNDVLGPYLDDPLQFFVPARLIRGMLLILAIVLLAQVIDTGLVGAIILAASGIGIALGMGQLLPALIVRLSPERVLEILLPPFTVVANALSPVTALVISALGAASTRHPRNGNGAPPDEAAAPTEPAGPQQAVESRLLRSVVNFGETLVREVMTPRPDIVAIRSDATLDELRHLLQEQEYSRLPVFTDNLDNIVGLIVVKDLIQRPESLAGSRPVAEIMRPAAFVPETKRVMDLLREFQQGRFQLAIVVDEYGGTAGLVTVEDVVEELVGEIRDEYDSEAEPIVREDDDTYVFSAKVGIGEMTERLGVQIEEGDFETVGGYVLTRVGRVPDVGERFAFDGLGVEILEAEGRRIHKVRVRRAPQPEEVAG